MATRLNPVEWAVNVRKLDKCPTEVKNPFC
jgi:hypothetical protein